MGDSAGGNLAAVTALRARDEAFVQIAGQVLIYPVIDAASKYPSKTIYADGYLLTAQGIDWFWSQYLSAPVDASHPHASPIRAVSLEGLPPALVLTTEFDVARDEGEAYAAALDLAGAAVTLRRIDGLIHGAYCMSGVVPRSAELHQSVVAFLGDLDEQRSM